MSESEAVRFFETVKTDEKFLSVLDGLKDSPDAVYAEIKKRGFDCTPDEIKAEFMELAGQSLSDDELNEIAAGHRTSQSKFGIALAVIELSPLPLSQLPLSDLFGNRSQTT